MSRNGNPYQPDHAGHVNHTMRAPAQPFTPSYEDDVHAWALANAALLRAQRFDEIDFENIAEELEGMARRERQQLENRLIKLLAHLLKWTVQPNQRERSKNSWCATIREQRRRIHKLLKENPSLTPTLIDVLTEAYQSAVDLAVRDTNLRRKAFPAECQFALDLVIYGQFPSKCYEEDV